MTKNLLNNYVELNKDDKVSLLKLLKEDLGNIEIPKVYKKYDKFHIGNDKYFVFNVRENEIDICMKDVLTRSEEHTSELQSH